MGICIDNEFNTKLSCLKYQLVSRPVVYNQDPLTFFYLDAMYILFQVAIKMTVL